MARLEINRSGEMEVFLRVVELGGFSAAARTFRMTPSAVSKLIARLEARLGSRLINRSTRQFQLSPEGLAFYERGVRVIADLEEAERSVGAGERPVGRVRVNTSASYGTHVLAPILPAFLERYPDVKLDIVQTDAVVDLLVDHTDVAIRAGPLKSSRLVVRKLGESPMIIVAAPAYLDRRGVPATIKELLSHSRLGFSYARAVNGWPLRRGRKIEMIPTGGRVQASDGEGLRQLALAGLGLARLASFTVREDIAAGRLVQVLLKLNPATPEVFHAVFIGAGALLPARVRVLLDYVAENGTVT